MNTISIKVILLATAIMGVLTSTYAQPADGNSGTNLDQIVGIVANEVILKSEIELQYQSQGAVAFQGYTEEQAKCLIMEGVR